MSASEARKLSFAADLLDRISNGFISDVLRRGDMEGKLGSAGAAFGARTPLYDRVMLVGLGKERDFREKNTATPCAPRWRRWRKPPPSRKR